MFNAVVKISIKIHSVSAKGSKRGSKGVQKGFKRGSKGVQNARINYNIKERELLVFHVQHGEKQLLQKGVVCNKLKISYYVKLMEKTWNQKC